MLPSRCSRHLRHFQGTGKVHLEVAVAASTLHVCLGRSVGPGELRRLEGLDAHQGDVQQPAHLRVDLSIFDLSLRARPAEERILVVAVQAIGALDSQSHVVEPRHHLFQCFAGGPAPGLLVAPHHVQRDVDVVNPDLLEEPEIVGPVEPVGAYSCPNLHHLILLRFPGALSNEACLGGLAGDGPEWVPRQYPLLSVEVSHAAILQ